MKSVAFHNLGCKVNSYEMDVMQQYFQKKGYSIVDFAQKADIYIINTCTVTNIADRKSRQMIHRARSLNPEALIVATGCYVQTHCDELENDPAIDLAIGNDLKKDIVDIVEDFLEKRKADEGTFSEIKDALCDIHIRDLSVKTEYEELELYKTAEHTRAYIKIQDGCNQFCSYCAIPYARGRVRSRNEEAVIREALRMAKEGYREIVLTGIHISSYGTDFENADSDSLLQLLDRLSDIEGIDRIRLSSLEPRIITGDFAKRLSYNKKICPHFHLSLQSGCDSVLKRMNRKYTTADFKSSVDILRSVYDDPAITTDIIAGFPGESSSEHESSLEFVEGIGFYETHIFPYSRRKGTAADKMPGQLTEKEKKERCNAYKQIHDKNRAAYIDRTLGKKMPVLFERIKSVHGKECLVGHTTNYIEIAATCNDIPDSSDLVGSIAECRLEHRLSDGMVTGYIV